MKLKRLHRYYTSKSPAPKEDGHDQLSLLSLSSLPDVTGSFSPDEEIDVCGPPRIGHFCNKDENLDKETEFIKEGALAFAHQSGISPCWSDRRSRMWSL